MNIFRLLGDLSHLLAIVVLLLKIWKTRSCAGISGKSQILYAVIFTTRYLDLLTSFVSPYNTVMKVIFIVVTYATIYLMYIKFKKTYDRNHDTFRIEFLIIPAIALALHINHAYTVLEVLWTFSIYLESVAILPQLFLVSKAGEAESILLYYLFALGSYRALYILNWIYRYHFENHYDLIAIVAGVVQVFFAVISFTFTLLKTPSLNPFHIRQAKESIDGDSSSILSDEYPYDELDKPAAPKFEGSAFNTMRAADLFRPAVNHGGPQTPASPTGPGNAYCPSLTSASLYSAPPCKLDQVESLYGGTKSLYTKSVYSKVPPGPMYSRVSLPQPGPLVHTQSLYPMRFSQNHNTTNQNVQNQQNQLQQRSESVYVVRQESN